MTLFTLQQCVDPFGVIYVGIIAPSKSIYEQQEKYRNSTPTMRRKISRDYSVSTRSYGSLNNMKDTGKTLSLMPSYLENDRIKMSEFS